MSITVQNYIVYLILLIIWITAAFATRSRGREQTSSLLIGLLATTFYGVLIGLRDRSAGNDTIVYVRTYDWLPSLSGSFHVGQDLFGNAEPLFWPSMYLFKIVGLDAEGWIFVLSLLTISFAFLAYRIIAKNWILAAGFLIVLCGSYYLLFVGNIIRQVLVVPFVILALHLIDTQRLKQGLILAAVASMFHFSGAFAAIYPFINRMPLRFMRLTPILGLVLSFLVVRFIPELVSFLPASVISSKVELYFVRSASVFSESAITTMNFGYLFVIYLLICFSGIDTFASRVYILFFASVCLFLSINELPLRLYPYLFFVLPMVFHDLVIVQGDRSYRVISRGFVGGAVLVMPLLNYLSESFVFTLGWE